MIFLLQLKKKKKFYSEQQVLFSYKYIHIKFRQNNNLYYYYIFDIWEKCFQTLNEMDIYI